MLAMSKRAFLSVRGLAVHRARLWLASQAQAQVSGTLHKRSIAGAPLDRTPGKRAYAFTQHDSGPPPLSETTPQSKAPLYGLLRDGPTRAIDRASSFGSQEAPPEWVYTGLYTFFLQYYRSTYYSISCLGLLLTRDLFRSCPGLLDVVEQWGFRSERGPQAAGETPPQEPATRVSPPYSTSHSARIQLHMAGCWVIL